MKASELRIGNIVFSKISGGLITIQYIPIDIDMDNYGAVKLTEERLLKFGFENSYRSDFTITMQHVTNDKFGIKINVSTGMSLVYLGIPIRVEYVHQLQNLYFALCGEELELK